jgi:hypothetical protein
VPAAWLSDATERAPRPARRLPRRNSQRAPAADIRAAVNVTERLHSDVRPEPSPVKLLSTYAEQDIADMIAASAAVGFICKSSLSCDAIRDLLPGRGDDGNANDGAAYS